MTTYEVTVEDPPSYTAMDAEVIRLRLSADGKPGQAFNSVIAGLELATRSIDAGSAHHGWLREAVVKDAALQIEESVLDFTSASAEIPNLEPRWAQVEQIGLDEGHEWTATPGQTVHAFEAE